MDCIGRTKQSNYRKRCTNKANLMFCWQHKFQLLILLVASLAAIASLAEVTGYSARDILWSAPEEIDLKVFFKGYDEKSDFTMDRGKKTLMIISIPDLRKHENRIITAQAFIRPVNYGSRSIREAQLTTIYPKNLWSSSYTSIEKESIGYVFSGKHDFKIDYKLVNNKWVVSRALPRIDPLSGARYPISFTLELAGISHGSELGFLAAGEIDITLTADDYPAFKHTLDIRVVRANSLGGVEAKCKALVRSLKAEGYPDIPVVLALSGGETVATVADSDPIAIVAKLYNFLSIKGSTVHEF